MQKRPLQWFLLLTLLLLLILGITFRVVTHRKNQQKTLVNCMTYQVDQCPRASCVVCPPCPECSSLSCQTEAFCKSMGIDRRWYDAIKQQRTSPLPSSVTNLANPAATNCLNLGGSLEIVNDSQGQQGYCVFKNGKKCDEWALFRKECQP